LAEYHVVWLVFNPLMRSLCPQGITVNSSVTIDHWPTNLLLGLQSTGAVRIQNCSVNCKFAALVEKMCGPAQHIGKLYREFFSRTSC